MLDVWPNCFLSHLPRSLFVSVFVNWLKYPVIGAFGFYLDILLDAGWCMVTRWQRKYVKYFMGFHHLGSSTHLNLFNLCLNYNIQLFMCHKEMKKEGKKRHKRDGRKKGRTGLDSCLGFMGWGTSRLVAGCPPSPFTPKLFDFEGILFCKTQHYVIEGILWVHKCVMKFASVRVVKHGKEKWNWIFGGIFIRPALP